MAEPRLQRVLRVTSFDEEQRRRPRLTYWLSRPPAERGDRPFGHGRSARVHRIELLLDVADVGQMPSRMGLSASRAGAIRRDLQAYFPFPKSVNL